MNPAPADQATDNRQQITDNIPPVPPTVVTSPSPTPPLTSPSQPTTHNLQPTTPPHHKFPFMMITLFLSIVLAGFVGSFLFLSYKGQNSAKTPAQVQITPPVTVAATQITPTESVTNPFATASGDLGTNPFASPTAVTNPFGTYQNPFGQATISATPNPVTNPFEK